MTTTVRKRVLCDCIEFGQRYFEHLVTSETAPFHRELLALAADPVHDRLSILAPRGHAKSTWLSIIFPIWNIVKNRDIRILIVSDTGDQAEMFLRAIKQELEANERLIDDFGAFHASGGASGKKAALVWKSHDITVIREARMKDPTVVAAGSGKRIVGRRADLIIVDDPLNDSNTEDARQRAKTLRWFRKTLTPILVPDTGRMLVIGTRKHPEDLHAELGRNPRYHQVVYRALTTDAHGAATPLWPDRWPLDRLLAVKEEIGSLVFAQEYQNEPVSEETAFFRREWIERCLAPDETLVTYYRGDMPVVTGWDLALVADRRAAEERDSDYTVGVTLALGADGTRHVLDIFRERGLTPAEILDVIRRKAEHYQPALISLENNLFQSLYERELASSLDIPVIGHTTGAEKRDVFRGVPSLSVLFERRRFSLPCGDDRSAEAAAILTRELVGLGVETHDDTVMALWIAECAIRRYRDSHAPMEVIQDPAWG